MAIMNSQNTAAANQLNSQTQSQLAAQALFAVPVPSGMPNIFQNTPPPPQP
jgi:hypothetical protein